MTVVLLKGQKMYFDDASKSITTQNVFQFCDSVISHITAFKCLADHGVFRKTILGKFVINACISTHPFSGMCRCK